MRKVVFVYLFFCMLENLASGKTVEGFNRRLPKLMTRYHIKSRLCLYGYKKNKKDERYWKLSALDIDAIHSYFP